MLAKPLSGFFSFGFIVFALLWNAIDKLKLNQLITDKAEKLDSLII